MTSQSNPAVREAFAFTGRLFDADTGLQYNLNRWYDPTVGRWISEDPIGFGGGDANVSRYVGNAAVSHLDPCGLSDKSPQGPTNVTNLAATLPANAYYAVAAVQKGTDFGGGTGHAWPAIVDTTTTPPTVIAYGFGPATDVESRNSTVLGKIYDDSKCEFESAVAKPISKQQYAQILAKMKAKKAAPGQYQVLRKNCAAWTMEAVGSVIAIPERYDDRVVATDGSDGRFFTPGSLYGAIHSPMLRDALFFGK